jgi:hypothetical protein
MLIAVHTVQVLFLLVSARLVVRKLRQLKGPAEIPRAAAAPEQLLAALRQGDAPALAAFLSKPMPGFQRDLLEAAIDGLTGEGDAGSFVHTASLEAQHEAIAGARVIRGFATLAGTLGLLGAMAHQFWLLSRDPGAETLGFSAAREGANEGAFLSMGLGLGTAVFLFASSRIIRTRIVARLRAIADFARSLEAAVERCEEWTEPAQR